jgi:hypothetical protein
MGDAADDAERRAEQELEDGDAYNDEDEVQHTPAFGASCPCESCQRPDDASRLRLVPLSLKDANEHVTAWHRHNKAVVQCIYRVGVADEDGVLRAVAIVERPKARGNADGDTVEITRLASDGTRNACSMLYGACARAAFALGYRRVITYIQGDEPGSSVKAAGFRIVAERPARKGWSAPSRPRDNSTYRSVPRQLWEVVV